MKKICSYHYLINFAYIVLVVVVVVVRATEKNLIVNYNKYLSGTPTEDGVL